MVAQAFLKKFWDYAVHKLTWQNWQGGQSAARRTQVGIHGAHGVTRPTQKVCQLHNPKKFRLAREAGSVRLNGGQRRCKNAKPDVPKIGFMASAPSNRPGMARKKFAGNRSLH
jgi:hypothetical protein